MISISVAVFVGVVGLIARRLGAGKYAPSLPLAFRIAHAFGAPLEDVFQYDGDAARRPGSGTAE